MNDTPHMCMIWDGFPAIEYQPDELGWIRINSRRAAGAYAIAPSAIGSVSRLTDPEKARVVSWLINQRTMGVTEPRVSAEVISYAKDASPLPMVERAERLLTFIVQQVPMAGSPVLINNVTDEAYAWSESTDWQEIDYFLDYLRAMGWISGQGFANGGFHGIVTLDGYQRVAETVSNASSTQVFVAMWIDVSTDNAFYQGIVPAIKQAGYKPLRIDQKPDVVKIDDEIMAGIRQSHFLVADFTQFEREARGGVYFEAGFAEGLGIPVIYTCRKDVIDAGNLHFDTRQYAHIIWESPEELRVDLLNRIRARIGQGPINDA